MRLIDADEFFKNFPELAIEPYINAPTVEAKTTGDCIIAYGDGYETARRLYERPQGEWVKMAFDDKTIFYCSKCHSHFEYPFNFCPNCGARMGGQT